MSKCTVCDSSALVEPCHLGNVRMRFCAVCMQGAGAVLAAWTLKRMREVAQNAARAEEEARQIAKVASALEAEMLPRGMRRRESA